MSNNIIFEFYDEIDKTDLTSYSFAKDKCLGIRILDDMKDLESDNTIEVYKVKSTKESYKYLIDYIERGCISNSEIVSDVVFNTLNEKCMIKYEEIESFEPNTREFFLNILNNNLEQKVSILNGLLLTSDNMKIEVLKQEVIIVLMFILKDLNVTEISNLYNVQTPAQTLSNDKLEYESELKEEARINKESEILKKYRLKDYYNKRHFVIAKTL